MLPETLSEEPLAQAIEAHNAAALRGGLRAVGELSLEIDPAHIVDVLRMMKQQEQFNRLSSVTAVDWYPVEPRFEVVYYLHSLPRNLRLRLKCRLRGDAAEIDSATAVWDAANWYEREVFDLFGIQFRNHPDLRRIMMPDDWEGHPLRRDFPVHGHKYSYQNE